MKIQGMSPIRNEDLLKCNYIFSYVPLNILKLVNYIDTEPISVSVHLEVSFGQTQHST